MTLYLHSVLLLHCYAKQQMQALRHPLVVVVVVVVLLLLQFSLQLQQMMMELRRIQ
jgi:hypothetical protein